MIKVFAYRDGEHVAELVIRDPQLEQDGLDALAVWGAGWTTLNGQNYPDGDGPREGFVS